MPTADSSELKGHHDQYEEGYRRGGEIPDGAAGLEEVRGSKSQPGTTDYGAEGSHHQGEHASILAQGLAPSVIVP